MMQGAAVFALRNVSRTVRSDSPTHLLRNSGPRTEMKFASASVATAFARSVLPVPGGPYNMMPRGGRASKWANSLFIFNGHSIDSRISCFASSRPPMSSQWTFGLSMRTSRSVEGSIARYADLDLPVEATGSTQRGVEGVRAIRRTDHDDLAASLESVHEREQLGDDPTFHLAGDLLPFRSDAVQFVDEDDARRVLLGLFEDVPQVLFALAVELRHDLRSRDGMEVRVRLGGDRLREERLARPRRSVKEDALRGLDAESFEQLRVAQREFDHLPHLADLLAEPADVLVVDLGDLRRFFLRRLLRDFDFRPWLDQDGVRAGRERRDDEVELAPHHADAQHIAARNRPPLEDLGHVLLAAHNPNRFRRGEGDLLGGTSERLPEAHLVVDAHAGVPSLHAVHADHPAVRVLGIPATDARRRGLGAQDQDDVPFLELEDLHDLGVDPDDPSTCVRGFRLRDAQKFLTTGRHG